MDYDFECIYKNNIKITCQWIFKIIYSYPLKYNLSEINPMMNELKSVRQIDGEPRRRWFWSDFFDLIVWFKNEKDIIGFQLCYDKNRYQRVLTWKKDAGYSHDRIDDGEGNPGRYKATPVLAADGIFEEEKIAALFKEESQNIDTHIADFVYTKILEYEVR